MISKKVIFHKKIVPLLSGGLIILLALIVWPSATTAFAQTGACPAGQAPQFVTGFASLKNQLGEVMGEPVECERFDGAGNAYQKTATGEAFYQKSTGLLIFSQDDKHWALTPQGLINWTGAITDVPTSVAPTQTVTSTTSANLDWPYYGHDPGNMRYVDIDQINCQATTRNIFSDN